MTMINQQLALFDTITAPHKKCVSTTVINVASVPQRSPFRYPGGKTWAVPIIRKWLGQAQSSVSLLVEPFCGGGIASLTAVAEGLAQQAEMIELDHEVAAVWKTITGPDNSWLLQRILSFDLTPENVKAELERTTKTLKETAFVRS